MIAEIGDYMYNIIHKQTFRQEQEGLRLVNRRDSGHLGTLFTGSHNEPYNREFSSAYWEKLL